ncbi:hypothetical protein ANOBCDAF_03922 [Pleomorphomonas sp. T1.2MG-36]|nr:hypothetical protein ANOBCDAF_03922 [Pleomorphomonas sp. T1.2MG-36]
MRTGGAPLGTGRRARRCPVSVGRSARAAYGRGGPAAITDMFLCSRRNGPLRRAVKIAILWTAVALVVAPVVGRIIDEQGK